MTQLLTQLSFFAAGFLPKPKNIAGIVGTGLCREGQGSAPGDLPKGPVPMIPSYPNSPLLPTIPCPKANTDLASYLLLSLSPLGFAHNLLVFSLGLFGPSASQLSIFWKLNQPG